MSETPMVARYAATARAELGNALENLEFVGGPPDRPLHAQVASAYALLALVEQTRELTNEVRALREQRANTASPVTHRWWNRGGKS